MYAKVYRSAADDIKAHIPACFPFEIRAVDTVDRVKMLVVAGARDQVMPHPGPDDLQCMIVARGIDHRLGCRERALDRGPHGLVPLAEKILIRIDESLEQPDRKAATAMYSARFQRMVRQHERPSLPRPGKRGAQTIDDRLGCGGRTGRPRAGTRPV